jgi:hypothetical protein
MPVPPPSTARALMASTGAAHFVRRTAPLARSIFERKDTHELAEKDLCSLGFHKEKWVSDGMVECEWCGILVFDEDDDFYRGS